MKWFCKKKKEQRIIAETKFKCLDHVKVTKGFYRGQTGILKSMMRDYYLQGDITYALHFDNEVVNSRNKTDNYARFTEDQLELV